MVVVVLECSLLASNNNNLFATLSIFVPSSNLVYPSQVLIEKIAPLCDIIFVIGSKNSSNSLRLVEVAKRAGCKNTLLIDSKKEGNIKDILKYKNIGITSGASAPENLVFDLINELKKSAEVNVKNVEVA